MKTRNRVDPQHTAVYIRVANSSTAALRTCIFYLMSCAKALL